MHTAQDRFSTLLLKIVSLSSLQLPPYTNFNDDWDIWIPYSYSHDWLSLYKAPEHTCYNELACQLWLNSGRKSDRYLITDILSLTDKVTQNLFLVRKWNYFDQLAGNMTISTKHRHTDRQTMSKLLHPSLTRGVISYILSVTKFHQIKNLSTACEATRRLLAC